jgi:heme/copper-type cytochrome/quinol oxidase subunit 2
MILKGWLLQVDQTLRSTPINTNLVNDYLFYYFFAPQNPNKIGRNQDLYKSQFRPLKKGITTMLRLHATGAVALPIEIRLQILASSRDVIHSWAVPSAGVKIDCVPGYTSHRIMTFLTPGIY